MKTPLTLMFFLSQILFVSVCHPQTDKNPTKVTVSPTILEAKDGGGATLGLEYNFSSRLVDHDRAPADPLNPGLSARFAIDVEGSGTAAASAAKNPKNFLDFSAAAKGIFSSQGTGTFIGSGRVKFETDQGFDNKQGVFGILGTYAKTDLVVRNDTFGFQAGYSRVDPHEDKERKLALGSVALSSFNRWESEVLYMLPTRTETTPMVEFNFKYFAERNAPLQVRSADIAIFRLATIRLSLKNDFFIAYSYGKLPFDRTKDRIVQAGWSYKLK